MRTTTSQPGGAAEGVASGTREPAAGAGLDEVYAPIADDLAQAQRIFHHELTSENPAVRDLCGHISRYQGKRLRPALLLLSAQACGGVRSEHHVLAAVVEMVHLATLVHDDVIDQADLRRHVPTVNRLCGNERAVLLGDLLISHAFHLCSSLDSQLASREIGRATNTVCEGELMQNMQRGNLELSEDEYLEIIRRKTAALVGACGYLGARFAGADGQTCGKLRSYGESLGVAFQITDDLLDLTGHEARVGKSLGLDVQRGTLTLPLIHYLRTCDPGQRTEMLSLLRQPSPDDGPAAPETDGPAAAGPSAGHEPLLYRQVARMLEASSSIAYARQRAAEHVQTARAMLATLRPGDARDRLGRLAEMVLERQQ